MNGLFARWFRSCPVQRPATARLSVEELGNRTLPSLLTPVGHLGDVHGPAVAHAQSVVTGPQIKVQGEGTLDMNNPDSAVLHLSGTASHLGKFDCSGEIAFQPGEEEGSLEGYGIVAFTAANGDQLVGIITWHINADGTGQASFAWRDAVTFADGTTAESTGRFAESRPPGANVSTSSNQLGGTIEVEVVYQDMHFTTGSLPRWGFVQPDRAHR